LVALPFVVAAVAACSGSTTSVNGGDGGSSDSGGSDGGSSVTQDQACTDEATAICNKLGACDPFIVELAYGDVATCTTRFKLSCTLSLGATGTAATPSSTEACAQAVPSISCDDAFARKLPAACNHLSGQLANGQACGDDSQCLSTFCNKPKGQVCGVCGAPSTAGSACNVDDDCPYGTVCWNSTCAARAGAGAACGANPCLESLACKNGTCSTPDAVGASCANVQNDIFGTCDHVKAVVCSSGTCAQIQLAQTGAACGLNVNGKIVLCQAAGFCKGETLQAPGTCVAAAADGSSCDATKGPSCMGPAQCMSGLCKLPDPSSCH
jgi:hypothetical protein